MHISLMDPAGPNPGWLCHAIYQYSIQQYSLAFERRLNEAILLAELVFLLLSSSNYSSLSPSFSNFSEWPHPLQTLLGS